ncbi:MAG: electron transport complex subunit RsxC [Planctomycetia bacterium]|uniref:Ion-translocating oxidoreductase complex subunit C n=2 Tax=Candidatus Brocadia sapporoensis TaxID=392547 RepID=A0A1V6LY39_9BACT|nr:electron transport complex subunit RsxC [Candidatus Brocadia sp.]OQD45062.1 electron transport complex subunit RsxC [Candidatus Brocadia sapporoensis]QOJ07959.1 MAG: electron transport complex subunit RsxC [Planctomycetia bacterium]TVL96260.1 MAG: electron transport complex subunit RsxC [Candidatus Brocadia sp. BL1]
MTLVKSQLKTFLGGIHPAEDGKILTLGKQMTAIPLPRTVYLVMSQHIGAPAKPVVKKGDFVKKGQMIGDAQGFISAHVHASVSGKVVDVVPWPHPVTGIKCPAVVIENSGEDVWMEDMNVAADTDNLSPEEIRHSIQSAGIVGLGGATFPTHVKLTPPKDRSIDTMVLNGAECEPFLTCDYRLMLDKPHEIIEGLKLIMRCIGCKKAHIGIEENKRDVYNLFKDTVAKDPNIKVDLMEVKYPQGAEHQLIKALLNREFKPTQLPLEVGVVVVNVGTAFAVYEAVKFSRPLIERIVTVTGNGVKDPQNFLVRVGTPVRQLLEAAKLTPDVNKIIFGGPMMGIAQGNIDTAVTIKGTGGILALRETQQWESRACIRCGRCVDSCPYGLNPSELSIVCEAKEFDLALDNNVMECKECGCCSYVCPAKRPIVHLIKFAKSEIAKRKAKG